MYKLLYLDEESAERHKFQRVFQDDFEIDASEPYSSVDECVDHAITENYDAVVTDFRLNEHSAVNFRGTDVVSRLLEVRIGFPVIILTGYPNGDGDDVAIDHVTDANIVYDKLCLDDTKQKSLLKDVISTNIKIYKDRINKASQRLSELVGMERLSPKDESELLELDSFLERSMDAESAIPNSIKAQFIEHKFDEIISLGREILEANGK